MAREPLLTPPILNIIYIKVIIKDFYVLSCVFYKELYKRSFIYSVLG